MRNSWTVVTWGTFFLAVLLALGWTVNWKRGEPADRPSVVQSSKTDQDLKEMMLKRLPVPPSVPAFDPASPDRTQ
jgi:hypothetical protein